MSHFTVIVTKTNEKSYEEQLARFDEGIEVEPYDRPCYCVGRLARRRASDMAMEQLKTDYDTLREEYWAMPEGERPDWKEHIKQLSDLEDKLEKEQPDYNQPDLDCPAEDDGCGGTGTYKSTYNPDSKWDWYQVGGRWTGYFKLKKDRKMPHHIGQPGVFDNEPKHDADVAYVGDIDFEAMAEDIVPFAILHDDVWYEQGSMGWWGVVSDAKDKNEWNKQVLSLLKGLPEDIELTAVDCHI